ncbi:hypothetical protein GCM10007872_08380 [Gluconobacter sphaericus NBRC 12467]|uniref:Uncharacterized protein n=1 Tax=Gluconobacter sphaericus NBRC 12467 TaxID=1307951 RepID=A0AA37W9H0_9PROT|nr:hypothetical protein GSP01_27680 [Gluconobacter sphaericus NBRC 12467]GLQ83930.1 hypothetical protein GCM10007872_08380 [Gluconobacter sphaericus NBRC 12467]
MSGQVVGPEKNHIIRGRIPDREGVQVVTLKRSYGAEKGPRALEVGWQRADKALSDKDRSIFKKQADDQPKLVVGMTARTG